MFFSHVAACRVVFLSRCFVPLIALLFAAAQVGADDWPPVGIDASSAKIEEALTDHTVIEFIETPLEDVVHYLKDLHGIEIQIDSRALEDVGLDTEVPITRDVRGITLRSALRLFLKELDLTYVLRDEVLLITTPEEAEADTKPFVQVYNVEPLLDDEHGVDELIGTIESAFDDGMAGRTSTFRGLLVVRGTLRQHQELRKLLGVIAGALDVEPPRPVAKRDRPLPMGEVRRARRDDRKPDEEHHADPFDGGGGEEPDPFGGGGGEDPFGGDDPFGGGADPFGGAVVVDPNLVDPFAH